MPARKRTPGIVLSGGGMRGAYEAGVVAGVMQVLGRKADDAPLFRVMAGTSVGAINAAFLASRSERGDHGVEELLEFWRSLRLETHAKLRLLGLMRLPKVVTGLFRSGTPSVPPGVSLLDTRELEKLVAKAVDFERIRDNVREGRVNALLIAALHVVSGQTTVFAEIAPGARYVPSTSGMRVARVEPISIDHVLASAAIPLLFPTRKVGERFYCDGGLRFNTPIAPAIRAGADPLLVISVSHRASADELQVLEREHDEAEGMELGPMFLVGKLLNALLLDPVKHDLQVLARLNDLVEVLENTLTEEEYERVQEVLVRTRGTGYRRLQTLVFSPSEDIGRLAGEHLRTVQRADELNPVLERFLARASVEGMSQEADWASYLLFDGGFAERLIDLGRRDALRRADEITAVFAQA
ncbi:MAG: patatin-like phospholipase family protein [Myxococcales bacterium]|nr:patatin-like phospholipase family protein [Myxococcales bacterium]